MTPPVGRPNRHAVESIRTAATRVFGCGYASACFSTDGILGWHCGDPPRAGDVQWQPLAVRPLESSGRPLRPDRLTFGHLRDHCSRRWLRRAGGLSLDSRSAPTIPVAAANIACPQSPASMPERLRSGAGRGDIGTMNGGSTLVCSVRGGDGCANPLCDPALCGVCAGCVRSGPDRGRMGREGIRP